MPHARTSTPPPVWPPLGTKPPPSHVPRLGMAGTPGPGDAKPGWYALPVHATFRGRRPRAHVAFAGGSKATLFDEPSRQIIEPSASPVPMDSLDELTAWWNRQGGTDQVAVDAALLHARRAAAEGEPWYNQRDRSGQPIGLWHAVEELDRGVTLFNRGEAWLEWTWLIYAAKGIVEPVRRSWSAGVLAEPGLVRASGHRAFPVPPPFHPSLLIADAAVFGQTTPDPDQPGMVIRA